MRRALESRAIPAESSGNSNGLDCPDCKSRMDLHQPDMQNPRRILGICPECQGWNLIDMAEDGRVKMTRLADSL